MKKYSWVIPVLLLCLSCNKTAGPSAANGEVSVLFGTRNSITEVKGGTARGAMGGWSGEDLFVYGLLRSGKSLNLSDILIDNVKASAPENGAAGEEYPITVVKPDGEYYHYSKAAGDRYDFFAYFVDDARLDPMPQDGRTPASALHQEDGTIRYHLTIDGTQDVMMAFADPVLDSQAKQKDDPSREWVHYAYSATAARNGLHPNLIFEHQLSRFIFEVKTGFPDPDGSRLTIYDMDITSRKEAEMIVARPHPSREDVCFIPQGELAALPLWIPNPSGEGRLLYRDMEAFHIKPKDEVTHLGEIMAMPGESVYTVHMYLQQEGVIASFQRPVPVEIPIRFPEGKKAQAGYQYRVTLTVWGLEEVKISVTMKEWKEGNAFDIDPDEQELEIINNN